MKNARLALATTTLVVAGLLAFAAFTGWRGGLPGLPGLSWLGARGQPVAVLDPAQVIVVRTPGGMLEVAALERVEEFGWQTRYTCPVLDCGKLLGGTVSRLRVPVRYVYRVPLAATWELRREGDAYVLQVPPVQPSLPVAMDTRRLELQTQRGWLAPSGPVNEQSALRRLGPELERRASQPEYLRMQQPHAAATVAEFARKWMREQGQPLPARLRVEFRSGGG